MVRGNTRIILGAALTLALVAGVLKARKEVHAARWEVLALLNMLRGYH